MFTIISKSIAMLTISGIAFVCNEDNDDDDNNNRSVLGLTIQRRSPLVVSQECFDKRRK
jgi:hypothetical protein